MCLMLACPIIQLKFVFLQVKLDDEGSVTPPPAKRALKALQGKPPFDLKNNEEEEGKAEETSRKVC